MIDYDVGPYKWSVLSSIDGSIVQQLGNVQLQLRIYKTDMDAPSGRRPHNEMRTSIVRMVTDISVQKDGEEIWAGRVLSESEDFLIVVGVVGGKVFVNDRHRSQGETSVCIYGWIEKAVTWDDVSDPAVLLEKAKAYLSDIQFDNSPPWYSPGHWKYKAFPSRNRPW